MAGQSALFAPIVSALWRTYKYHDKDAYGEWLNTSGAIVYAPETGSLVMLDDGTGLLRVESQGFVREWIIVSPLAGAVESFGKSPKRVAAGQPLGASKGNVKIALWVTPTGAKESAIFDPAKALIESGAVFVDKQPAAAAAAAAQLPDPNTVLVVDDGNNQPAPKKEFTAGQVAVAVIGGSLLGGLVVSAMRRR